MGLRTGTPGRSFSIQPRMTSDPSANEQDVQPKTTASRGIPGARVLVASLTASPMSQKLNGKGPLGITLVDTSATSVSDKKSARSRWLMSSVDGAMCPTLLTELPQGETASLSNVLAPEELYRPYSSSASCWRYANLATITSQDKFFSESDHPATHLICRNE